METYALFKEEAIHYISLIKKKMFNGIEQILEAVQIILVPFLLKK